MILLNSCEIVLSSIKDHLPAAWREDGMFVGLASSLAFSTQDWIERFWEYQRKEDIAFSELIGLPLLFAVKQDKKYLAKMTSQSMLILNKEGHAETLSEDLLFSLGAYIVENLPPFILRDDFLSDYVYPRTPNGIIHVIVNACTHFGERFVINHIRNASVTDQLQICNLVEQSSMLPNVFLKFPLFKTTNSKLIPCQDAKLVDINNIPPDYLAIENAVAMQSLHRRVTKFTFTILDFNEIVNIVLSNSCLPKQKIESCYDFIIERMAVEPLQDSTCKILKEI